MSGTVIWLTGMAGAGKSTLAEKMGEGFKLRDLPYEVMDGDQMRHFFEGDLGYSRKERIQNVRRITFAAKLLADHGVCPIVANIAPYIEVRDFIRKKLPRYVQIYLKAPLEDLIERDPKGLYARAKAGTEGSVIGLDDAYEPPRNPDLVLETTKSDEAECFQKISELLVNKGIWDNA